MKFVELNGDATAFKVLPNTTHFIPHVVNTQGIMGSGIAATIRDKFPEANRQYVNWMNYERGRGCEVKGFARILGTENQRWQLGNLQTVKVHSEPNGGTIWVCNMLAQKDFGGVTSLPPGRYEAIEECLQKLRMCVDHVSKKGKNISVESCQFGGKRAGLEWDSIFMQVQDNFHNAPGVWNTYSYEGPNS